MNNRGQTIVEVLIVSLIITVGLVGALGVFSQFYSLHQLRSEQITATYLAAEGIELVKNLIDENYKNSRPFSDKILNSNCTGTSGCAISYNYNISNSSMLSDSQSQLYINEETGLYSHNSIGKQSPYSRTIKITSQNDGKSMEVISTVNWQIRGKNYESKLTTYFYDWRD